MKLLYYINTSEIPSELSRENFIFADAGPKYINAGRLLLFTRKKNRNCETTELEQIVHEGGYK